MAKTIPFIVATLLLSLLSPIAAPAMAAPDDVKWSRVNLPTEGKLGAWSAVSGFTTESPLLPVGSLSEQPPPQPPTPSPSTPSPSTVPDWVKYLLGALLSAVVLLAVIVLVLVRGMRRL